MIKIDRFGDTYFNRLRITNNFLRYMGDHNDENVYHNSGAKTCTEVKVALHSREREKRAIKA